MEIAANLATIIFNDGAGSLARVLEEMGCHVSQSTIPALGNEDTTRLQIADCASSLLQKERRKKGRRKKEDWEEENTVITYEACGF